jgi:pimeloyl-ACP methyl ester carboxylesterase
MCPLKFKGELVFFPSKDNLKTAGFLIPANGKDVVIFIHGMGGHFYKDGFLKGAKLLLEHGISFFSFNTRGADVVKDFKDLNGEHHTLGTAFEKFEDSKYDIKAAIDFLESSGYENFHLMGHSTGCQKILYYAYEERDDRVKSLIHVSPAEDYEIWKNEYEDFKKFISIAKNMQERGEGNKIIIPLYEKTGELWSASRFMSFADKRNMEARMFNYENLEIFSEIKTPTLIFLGKDDPYFLKPVDWYAEKLRMAYHGKKLEIEIMPGDHSFHGYEEKIFERILGFVRGV